MKELADFIVANAGQFYKDWPRKTLDDWLCFHVENGSLSAAETDGRISAVIVGWQQATDTLEPEWTKPDPNGEWFHWSLFAADSHESALRVSRHFLTKHPEAARLPATAGRKGAFRKLKSLAIFTKAQRIYGNRRSSTNATELRAGNG